MKQNLLLFLLIICSLLCSCETDETVDAVDSVTPELIINSEDISANTLSIEPSGGVCTFTISSNLNWSVTSDADWLDITPNSGEAGEDISISVSVDANSTSTIRKSSIVFSCGDITESVSIEQQMYSMDITTNEYNIDYTAQQLEVVISSDSEIEVEIPNTADWITLITSKAVTNNIFTFDIDANDEYSTRVAEISFKNIANNTSEVVTISQAQLNAIIISQKDYNVDCTAQQLPITVSSNIDIELFIPSTVDWITLEPSTKSLSSDIYTLNIASNGYSERSAEIVFKNTSTSLSETVTITQSQLDAIIISEKEYSIENDAQQISVSVSSNVDVEVVIPSTVDWITLEPLTKSLSSDVFTLNISENGYTIRSAEVKFTNTTTSVTETITITQNKKLQLSDFDGTFTPSGDTWIIYDETVDSYTDFAGLNNTLIAYQRVALEFPNLKSIPDKAFYYENGIYSISCTNVESIGAYSFATCINLEYANFPIVKTISGFAFKGSYDLVTVLAPQVETIGAQAFQDCTGLAVLDISNVNSIGIFAFDNCRSLVDISLSSVTELGKYSFTDCMGLLTVDLPILTTLNEYVFDGCTKLKSVSCPEAVSIVGYAFNGCTSLESVTFPKATFVGINAFISCSSLKYASLPEVETFEDDDNYYTSDTPFASCPSLETVYLPKLTTLDKLAFYNLAALKTVYVPALTSIGQQAFQGCTSLVEVSFPLLLEAGYNAFKGCTSLETVSFPELVDLGGSMFSECTKLNSLYMPKAESVGSYAFYKCVGLTSISLPIIKTLYSNAFDSCSQLAEVNLPKTTVINDKAFASCDNLSKVSLATDGDAKITKWGSAVFMSGNEANITLTLGYNNASLVSNNKLTVGTTSLTFSEIVILD